MAPILFQGRRSVNEFGAETEELTATIRYLDGRHDRYDRPPKQDFGKVSCGFP
jgi:hypothetical protein